MPAKVTITVELTSGPNGQDTGILTRTVRVGDNPLYDAQGVEDAIADGGKFLGERVAALHGDIRNSASR